MILLAAIIMAGGQWTPHSVDGMPVLRGQTPSMNGVVQGKTIYAELDGTPAFVMNGSTFILVGDGETIHSLPSESFTVEAWVQIDAPQEWGGIVSALQDNGSLEKGWVLGYRKDRFSFGLSTEGYGDADGTMTYLTAPEPFSLRTWHHVAGTWDGSIQRLYVDGVLVAQDDTQEGAVRWPATAPFAFGAYVDQDERYFMQGLLGPAAVHDAVIDAKLPQLAARRDAPPPKPLVELALTGAQMRHFESGEIPGEDTARVLRLPWNTGPANVLDLDVLFRPRIHLADGGVIASLSGEHDGWVLNLKGGTPVLHVWRRDGEQVLEGAGAIEGDRWALCTVQADATGAALTVNGETRVARSILGPLAPAAHRHLVLAGHRADQAAGSLAMDLRAVNVFASQRSASALKASAAAAMALLPPPPNVQAGPIVRTLGDGRWAVEWLAGDSNEAWLGWSVGDEPFVQERAQVDGDWRRVVLQLPVVGMSDDAQLRVRVELRTEWGEWLRGDTHPTDLSIDLTDAGTGYVLYIEPNTMEPIERAAIGTQQVMVIVGDGDRAQALRRAARDRDLPANRFAVQRMQDEGLPFAPWLFNEIHVGHIDLNQTEVADVLRCVRPEGGRVYGLSGDPVEGFSINGDGGWERGAVPGAKWWARQYATPGHTSCSTDDVVSGDLRVLWWGQPGPRPMLDRGARAPSPLASHGRLFVQGNHAIFCVDAYNGSPRWTLSMPHLRRTNVPRDTSNMAVGPHGDLHLAVQDDLWIIDGETGRVEQVLHTGHDDRDWGLVDPLADGGQLCTHVPREAMYIGAEGEWYDGGGEESWRVAGDRLLRLDAHGREVWSIEPSGWILHSTIARDEDRVLYVEVPAMELVTDGRLPQAAMARQELVAVDLETGEELWRRALDVGHFDRMTYVLLAGDIAVVSGSSDKFHTLAFNAANGAPIWAKDHAWARDHHGGPLQHPVIVGDIVYVESCAYDLRNGDLLRTDIPQGRGCGTKTASNHLLAFRHHFHSFWDPDSNEWTEWTGTRGGCWLGLLPAGGMMLGPETSSGCSCTHAIQTSIAWIPAHLDRQLKDLSE